MLPTEGRTHDRDDALDVSLAPGDPQRAPTEEEHESASLAHLVVLAQAGDREAFSALYYRYVRLVYAVLLARVASDDAPDLVQDVFLQVLLELPRLRDVDAFPTWVGRIAQNVALGHLRSSRPTSELGPGLRAVDAPLDTRLDSERVFREIQLMPESLRVPLLLRLVDGMSGEEIAAYTGLSHGAIRVALHRGMRALRESLGPLLGDER